MTAVVGWVRECGQGQEELLIAADSRISGGSRFDAAPKILPFVRGDCALAFAGEVGFAYPLMLQLSAVVDAYQPARLRSLDIDSLRNHLILVFNDMLSTSLHSLATPDLANPDLEFLFGGYSSLRKRFELFVAHRVRQRNRFEWRNAETIEGRTGLIAFIGDGAHGLREETTRQIRNRERSPCWKWEPLRALRNICAGAQPDATVGGPPQVVKVCQYLQARDVPVFWPNRAAGAVALRGRLLLNEEHVDQRALDLNDFHLYDVCQASNNNAIQQPAAICGSSGP